MAIAIGHFILGINVLVVTNIYISITTTIVVTLNRPTALVLADDKRNGLRTEPEARAK